MHEMAIAQSMIRIIEEEMQKHRARVLRSVRLHIGEMTAIVPESLSFCFNIITENTALEGARLMMDVIPLKGYCKACDKEFGIKEYVFKCPSCQNKGIKTVAGHDLSIIEMDVD